MKKILLLAVIYIACFANAKAYFPPDSCLQVVPNITGFISNPDSLMWDTCGIKSLSNLYTNRGYVVEFKYNIIPRNYVTNWDSTEVHSLGDILPMYSWIKDSLLTLTPSLGTFTLVDEGLDRPDTTASYPRSFYLKFNRTHNLSNAVDSIKRFSFILGVYHSILKIATGGINESDRKENVEIFPNPAKNEILINLKDQLPPKEIQIVDEKGHLVLQTEFKEKINVSNLSRGVYFVKINNKIEKFIKE